ncbi:MAG: ATP-binding protein [Ardenticatenaceae bacterium]|nr:ATP-binding protein [Ardenticatenaceae bacterium]
MSEKTTEQVPHIFATGQDHLLAGLACVDLRIHWAVARARANGLDPHDEFRGLYISEAQVDTLLGYELGQHAWRMNGNGHDAHIPLPWPQVLAEARRQWQMQTAVSRSANIPLPLDDMARAFNLDEVDVDALLIALAPELDPRYERLFAYLQDDVTRKRPSIDLILNLLTDDFGQKLKWRQRFTANGRLIQHRLLARFINGNDREPTLLSQYVRPAAHLVEHLLGTTSLDEQLGDTAVILPAPHTPPQRVTAEFMAHLHRTDQSADPAPWFAFIGEYGVGRQEAAQQLAAAAQRPLLALDLHALSESTPGLAEGLALALRDGRLLGAYLYLTGWDDLLVDDRPPQAVIRPLLDYPHTVIVSSRSDWRPAGHTARRRVFPVTFPTPAYERRLQLWQNQFGDAPFDLTGVANHFRFTAGQIADAAATARDLAQWRGEAVDRDDLLAAGRAHSNQRLAALATKIRPRYRWQHIILPADTLRQLHEMVNVVQQRPTVYGQWGFGRKQALGKGLNALFAGESGTGKTMAADIMAHELGLDLVQNRSLLIGQQIHWRDRKKSQSHFHRSRDQQRHTFFDEADAIFGKRSEVKDSHDRYANIEISYLLQRMETYDGVVILATNLRANMDDAFTRRLHFVVEFPFPETEDRERIWRVNVPAQTPLAADVDFHALAERFRLAGGSIRNIILAAAFLAATDGEALGMTHLLHATRREFQKMGRLIDKRLFQLATARDMA